MPKSSSPRHAHKQGTVLPNPHSSGCMCALALAGARAKLSLERIGVPLWHDGRACGDGDFKTLLELLSSARPFVFAFRRAKPASGISRQGQGGEGGGAGGSGCAEKGPVAKKERQKVLGRVAGWEVGTEPSRLPCHAGRTLPRRPSKRTRTNAPSSIPRM